MPNLSIKDVPEAWAEALRRRAARNHRSLQGELMALVEAAALESADMPPPSTGRPNDPGRPRVVGHDKRGWPIIRQGWMTPEQLSAAIRARNPDPQPQQTSSVDLIREDRDNR